MFLIKFTHHHNKNNCLKNHLFQESLYYVNHINATVCIRYKAMAVFILFILFYFFLFIYKEKANKRIIITINQKKITILLLQLINLA